MGEVWLVPRVCPAEDGGCGQPYGPGLVIYSWMSCRCPGARAGGHPIARCQRDGCGYRYVEGHVGPEPEPERMPPLGRH